jgi:uncharacterized protein with FMN-binding domain
MSYQRRQSPKLVRTLRKYAASTFVIGSFVAYAVHERSLPATNSSELALAPSAIALAQATTQPVVALPTLTQLPPATERPTKQVATQTIPQPTARPRATALPKPTAKPTAVPEPTAIPTTVVAQGQYKDGIYTGDIVDAYYGNVQVQAVIQAGKITNVQFLDYPHDRRTSLRINKIAGPYLTTEAIQAQSAQVDLISGATLTSEAFVQSLQTALESAHA